MFSNLVSLSDATVKIICDRMKTLHHHCPTDDDRMIGSVLRHIDSMEAGVRDYCSEEFYYTKDSFSLSLY